MERNLRLWADDSCGVAAHTAEIRSVSQTWLDPSLFVDVIGVDFGSGQAHFYSRATGKSWKCQADVANEQIISLEAGTVVVAEWAHLATPRTSRSLSQPFSADELLDLYKSAEKAGVTIKLFPHYHSGIRARDWVAARFPNVQSAKKSDAADAMALAIYVQSCNGVSLADPPKSFLRCPKQEYGKAVREYSSIMLNAERTTGYRGLYFPQVIELGMEILRMRGRKIGEKACYSVASLIATEVNGEPLMFTRNGRQPGVEFWWRHVARMTPFHHKGGLARSNLMRHSFRPFLRKFGSRSGVALGHGTKIVPFSDHDAQQAVTRIAAMKSFRDTVKDCYRVGVKTASKMGMAMLDPIQTPCNEAAHGR